MKELLKKKIWQQTLAGASVLFAFPFLYFGGIEKNMPLSITGIGLILIGTVAAPYITFIGDKKNKHDESRSK